MAYLAWKEFRNQQQYYGTQYPTLEGTRPAPTIRKLDSPQKPLEQGEAYAAGFSTAMAQMGQDPAVLSMTQLPDSNHMIELKKMDEKRRQSGRPGFKIFSQALNDTGISRALSGDVPAQMTVFAPTDDAFKVFGEKDKEKFNNPQDPWAEAFLESHIVETEISTDMASGKIPDVANGVEAFTLHGGTLIRVKPSRDPPDALPPGAVVDKPLVQLIDPQSNRILAQAQITNANWMQGTGTVFSIDTLLIAPKS